MNRPETLTDQIATLIQTHRQKRWPSSYDTANEIMILMIPHLREESLAQMIKEDAASATD